MSLCNAFRLYVVCFIIVLSNIDAPVVAFTLRRTTTDAAADGDLAQEESVSLAVKRHLNVPDNGQFAEKKIDEIFGHTSPKRVIEQDVVTQSEKNSKYDPTTNLPTDILEFKQTVFEITESITESSINELQTVANSSVLEDATTLNIKNITEIETTTNFINIPTTSEMIIDDTKTQNESQLNTNIVREKEFTEGKNRPKHTEKFDGRIGITPRSQYFYKTLNKSHPMPKWKKYKTIDRKRPSHSSAEKVKEGKMENNKERILKAESRHVRVTLQDTVTSVIPSLESLKNDILSSTITFEMSGRVTLKPLITEKNSSSLSSMSSSTETIPQVGHESKRAGFLNYSGKTATEEATEVTTIGSSSEPLTESKTINIESRVVGTETSVIDVQEDKKKIDTQIVLNEDAIKEELLKEELQINNEDNAKRQLDYLVKHGELIENKNTSSETIANNSSTDQYYNLINTEKSKNNSLYTISPNYKPMKKIDVVPPKQFVRDLDDNSWRNESLSSLGIVFKPKNSSKPFTQVLKNKTETEWNNLSEKEIKNDLPDLRERLQKMAEKRKSKRKKLDSLGNVVYVDYEENSSSAEHAGIANDELTSTVTTNSPALQSPEQESGLSTEGPQHATTTATPTLLTEKVNKNYYTTIKPKFLHEYFDSIDDEDDLDYLNLANLDLKKFTTSLSPPFHPSTILAKQPDWLKVKSNKLSYNLFPERKATVQHFPPLTTQKVNNDYDNGFKFKMESFTTESDVSKHVPSVSADRLTTSVPANSVESKTDITRDFQLTQPQLTTDPGFGTFDRGTYVIKHYKDFINVAAKDFDYDKRFGYTPYTEAPATKPDSAENEQQPPRTSIHGKHFRMDALEKFVDNFNKNSDRYRSNFPILFNSSIIHRGLPNSRDIASSRAFMRGLFDNDVFKSKVDSSKKACEPNCDKLTVELSPAYELHYYMPEQEEKDEAAPQPVTLPYQYRL